MQYGFVRHAVEKAQADSAKGKFKVTPDAAEKLANSPIKDLQMVKRLLSEGSLDYRDLRGCLATGEVKKLVEALAKDDKLFDVYREALRVPGVTKLIAEFLGSKEGIDSFVMMGRNDAGLKLLIKLGQVPEGRDVAKQMLRSWRGWVAIYRIMKGLEQATPESGNRAAKVPSFDLSHCAKSAEPEKEMLPLLRNPGTAGAVFASLSENRENAELCCKVLRDTEVRETIFGYLTGDPAAAAGTFRELFASEERRKLMKHIFVSEGGKELLVELAGDVAGRAILMSLAVVPQAKKMGMGDAGQPAQLGDGGQACTHLFQQAGDQGGETGAAGKPGCPAIIR